MSNAIASEAASGYSFSLKSLFLFLTVVAVLVAPIHWFGGAYFFSAACSVVLVAACVAVYGVQRRGTALFAAIVGAMIAFVIAIATIVFALHAFLNVLLCLTLVLFRPKLKTFAAALAGLMIAVYGFSFSQAIDAFRRIKSLQDQYPMQSVAERLEFDHPSKRSDTVREPIYLATHVATNLYEQEQSLASNYYGREWALRELHDNAYQHFARAAGFGFMRMPSVHESMIDLEVTPLEMPWRVYLSPNARQELKTVHFSALVNFGSPDFIGYVRNKNAVAGFQSHQLRDWEDNPIRNNSFDNNWQVARLELVSLLRHEQPRVYVAASLPRMDRLKDVPHRALNRFEQRALPELTSKEDIVVRQKSERMLMLGAVRAGTTCLECHDGERGRLLGAFSYELTPIADDAPKNDSKFSALVGEVSN